MSNKAVIIGASSGVGRALAEQLALKNNNLFLVSSNERDLLSLSNNLIYRYKINCHYMVLDVFSDKFKANNMLLKSIQKLKKIDYLFTPIGYVDENDYDLNLIDYNLKKIVSINYLSVIQIISEYSKYFESTGKGNIVSFSSVAAGSPRRKNTVYSSSKLALEGYCKGLAHYFFKSNIKIQVYRLGYIDTSMSFGHELFLPPAKPEKLAKHIIQNLNKNKLINYYPKYWSIIIFILKMLPRFIYNRLNI